MTEKRVAAYCRVSTDHEDQANSFASQQRYFQTYIRNHPDWTLYEIFADEGLSGTSTKRRKAFQRMIDCARQGKLDLILTKEISRFARNTLDSIFYTRELKKYGVGVLFMNDGINTLDGDAELRMTILASMAQEESRKTSQRVKWGQKRQMEQGVVFGRSLLGYDVRGGKLYVNRKGADADIVRMIFRKFVEEKKGTHVIARELNQAGILPLYGRTWSSTAVLRILRNEKYCGDLVQKKTYTPDFLSHEKKINRGQEDLVILRDHHEPLVSRAVFEQAGRLMAARADSGQRLAKYSSRYPFSGKIKCGCCGASYVSRYRTRRDGSQYRAWRCYEANRNGAHHRDALGNPVGCSNRSVRHEVVLDGIRQLLWGLALPKVRIREQVRVMLSHLSDGDRERAGEDREAQRSKLLDLYLSGQITKEEFLAARQRWEILPETAEGERAETAPAEILDAVSGLLDGTTCDEVFYAALIDRLVVRDPRHMELYLKGISAGWLYAPGSETGHTREDIQRKQSPF